MLLSAIHTYPVKGCYRTDRLRSEVEPCGLAGDRRFMIVDEDDVMLTQRVEPNLVRIKPALDGDRLTLRAAGHADLAVTAVAAAAPGDLVDTAVHRQPVVGSLVDAAADDWLAAVLGRKVRLLWLDDPSRRPVASKVAHPGDRVSFADGYPVLLANTASLAAVNDWLAQEQSVEEQSVEEQSVEEQSVEEQSVEEQSAQAQSTEWPVPMTRFRPNIVVDGAPPWAEDGWIGRRVRVGGAVFRVAAPCARCIVITTDQDTGDRGREPLGTLARHRNVDQRLLFAVNLIPDDLGTISVGDEITVI